MTMTSYVLEANFEDIPYVQEEVRIRKPQSALVLLPKIWESGESLCFIKQGKNKICLYCRAIVSIKY